MKDIDTIKTMLTFRRPAGSDTEKAFIERFIKPLGVKTDDHGNHIKVVGPENPTILWSSHTDSVHKMAGYQKIEFDGQFIRLPKKSKSNCLGADCAAGVWIMSEMIKANVPGLYVFHAAEEIGCIGSRAIVKHNPELLANIKAAVAFDRKGYDSVITHQGSRCASDAFGNSVAAQLPIRFKNDPTGVLTDTKMYMHIVPECSNISVGYFDEHRPAERLDVNHLIELRDHMVKIDASKFVIERDPKQEEPKPKFKYSHGSYAGTGSLGLLSSRREPRTLYDLIYWHPNTIAKLLEDSGVTVEALKQYIEQSDVRSFQGGGLFDDPDEDQDDLFDDEDEDDEDESRAA
jgi:putative aminopeptidase FrvX